MTAANGLNYGPPVLRSTLHRCIGGVIAAMTVLVRPVRFHVRSPWSEPQRLAVATGAAVVMILLVMFLFDAAAINAVARLPNSIVWVFDQITDFGKSG